MRILPIIVSAAHLLCALPRATAQSTEQFLALYNLTSYFFELDDGLATGLVRMAFHDAMGGVDAHLDMTNDEHDGLEKPFMFLNKLWRINKMMSMGNGTYYGKGGNRTHHHHGGNRTHGRGDGMRGDGMRGDGGRGDGMRGDGMRGDGMRGDGERGDGMRGDGMRGDRGMGMGGGGRGEGRDGMFGGGMGMMGGGRGDRGHGRNHTDMMGRNHTHMGGRGDRRPDLMMLMKYLDPVDVEGLTKADFFAWVYIAAFYHTCRRHVPWVPLRFGRTTSEEAQIEDTPPMSELGSGNHAAVMAYFEDHFGFNEGQVAVLMGAHTLGGAERRNTGFVGDWTDSDGVFNNEYYENMLFPGGRGGWEQVAVANETKFEWRWGCNNRCRDLMLNVDMNLFYNLDDYFVGESGQVRLPDPLPATAPVALCSDPDRVFAVCFPEREGSATHNIVTLFEDGNTELFLDNFAVVFGDLISRVKDDATLGYVAPPADWPRAIRRGRPGRGGRGDGPGRSGDGDGPGRGGRGDGPGRGRPGRGGGPPRLPRVCGIDGFPDFIGFRSDSSDDFDGFDFDGMMGFDNDFDQDFDDEEMEDEAEISGGEEDITDEEEPEDFDGETPVAASRASDMEEPFTRRRLRTSA